MTPAIPLPPLDQAIARAGSQERLAQLLGVRQQSISVWRKRGFMPVLRAVEVEMQLGIPRQDLVDPRLRRAFDLTEPAHG